MRTPLILLALAALAFIPLRATTLGLTVVKQALYLHGSDSDPVIEITDVPFVTAYADPFWRFNAICKPFIPPSDGSWHEPEDVNLASQCGIIVSVTEKEDSTDLEVLVDASKAVLPEGCPFTLVQIVDSVSTCARLMYPTRPESDGLFTLRVLMPPAEAKAKTKAEVDSKTTAGKAKPGPR